MIGEWRDPLEALNHLERTLRGDDRATSEMRWVGYLSYDLGRLFEQIPALAQAGVQVPLFVFTCHRSTDGPAPILVPPVPYRLGAQPLRAQISRDHYLSTAKRVVEYIRAGDVFQVNLAQRFTAGLRFQPHEIYRHLVAESPASYGACLDYGDFALLCNSPELFLRVSKDRRIVTRPIKGTRPRAAGMEDELKQSLKDQAELNMIVDLERNDLGRVCRIGTVKVTEPRTIEAHPTVFHGVATVEGVLRDEVTFVDLLRAMFPGGSITGAPKVRAMQIIEELEPVRRGPYCGAIGYLSSGGEMQFNIAIRTMLVKDGLVDVSVGGGIVADSDPVAEYDETLVKARAMFAALGVGAPPTGC